MKTIGSTLNYNLLMPATPAVASAESDQIPVEHRPPAAASLSYDQQARHHFHAMPHDQQAQAIRRLAAAGQGDHTIARATGLSVEMIRRALADGGTRPTYWPTDRNPEICRASASRGDR